MPFIKLALLRDSVVEGFATAFINLKPGQKAVVIQPDLVDQPKLFWKSQGSVTFASSVEADDALAALAKKKEIAKRLLSVETQDELKAEIAAINDEVNP